MDECLIWVGSFFAHGYGRVWLDGKARLAHRVAYCDAHGLTLADIEGQDVLHSCDNPKCVNPNHLHLGTHKDNMGERRARGRYVVKVSDEDLETMKSEYVRGSSTSGQQALADKYGISRSMVSFILSGSRRAP